MKITKVTIPNTNYTKGREGNTINKVVLHWVVGSLATCDATFKNKDRKASAHYCIEDSTVHQYVEEIDTAWHAGNWGINTQSIGIEHSGGELLADGKTRRKPSPETHKTSAELVANICKKYAIPIDRKHILKHSEVSPTQCPGTTDIDLIIKLAKEQSTQPMIITPSSKLPDNFYEINEAQELIKRKRITSKDAWDTVLSKFIQLDKELNEQKSFFDNEQEALIEKNKKAEEGFAADTHTKNNYIIQLEAKVKQLEEDSKGTIQTAKDLINKLKGLFGL